MPTTTPTIVRRLLQRGGRRPPEPGILVNYWYSPAVGHMIEALRVCLGYATANPGTPVSLIVNRATPWELGACCPFVSETFAVPFTDFGATTADPRRALRDIPRRWEQVVDDRRALDPDHARFTGFWRYQAAARRHLCSSRPRGVIGRPPPAYTPHQQLRLELPPTVRAAASARLGTGPTISLLPAGSAKRAALYPSIASWIRIVEALRAALPTHRICLIGRYDDGSERTSSGIGRGDVARIVEASPGAIDAFDLPLLEQLACIEASDLFLSPHSGLGFAAVAVGTPWLTLSGGDWHETFFNGVPFHSLVPDTSRYPSYFQSRTMAVIPEDDDGEGERTPSMSAARIREDLPELVEMARRLVDGRVVYEDALAAYFPRLLAAYGGDRSRLSSFDDIHERYL